MMYSDEKLDKITAINEINDIAKIFIKNKPCKSFAFA